ncbi:MAG: hypothetical protein ACKPE6_06745, partial [Gammaproteobacteria bacterium]
EGLLAEAERPQESEKRHAEAAGALGAAAAAARSRAVQDEAQFGCVDPKGARRSMSRRLVVDASVVVDLPGRFQPEPIEE